MLAIKSDPVDRSIKLEGGPQTLTERDRTLPLILLGMVTLTVFVGGGMAFWISEQIVDILFRVTGI